MAESRHLIDFIIKWLGLIANIKALVLKSPVRGFLFGATRESRGGREVGTMGLGPIFCNGSLRIRLNQMARKERLIELLEAPVRALGYELVDLEAHTGRQGLLRIFIDQDEGINLDDCESVSRQLSAVLDVEDPIRGRYVLEVSSPGLDRPLRTPEHFQRYCGHVVRVKLNQSRDGQRNFKGRLLSVGEGDIVVEVDNEIFHLALSDIASAHLVAAH